MGTDACGKEFHQRVDSACGFQDSRKAVGGDHDDTDASHEVDSFGEDILRVFQRNDSGDDKDQYPCQCGNDQRIKPDLSGKGNSNGNGTCNDLAGRDLHFRSSTFSCSTGSVRSAYF